MSWQSCTSCKFWSSLIAKAGAATPTGKLMAMCLNHDSLSYGKYTYALDGCANGETGPPVDDPRQTHG